MIGFGIDEIQAEYVAEIKLRHLNREYILKRIKDIEQLENDIADLEATLASKNKMKKIIIGELDAVAEKYDSGRKSEVLYDADEELPAEVIEIADYPITLFLSEQGYLKKIKTANLRMSGEQKVKEGDRMLPEIECSNKDELLFFTNNHQVYKSKADDFADTHITMEEIRAEGISFDEAFADFSRWSRGSNVVFLSWSNSDLYTLADNYKRFKNTSDVEFMHYYADAQSYCMQFINDHNGSQISLSRCAEKFGVDVDTAKFHRALEDCFVTAYCLKKVFDKDKFSKFIVKCDAGFFERLVFKSYFINKPVYGDFDVNKVELKCPACSGSVSPFGKYEFNNNDELIVTQRLVAINKKRARFIN